VYLQLSGFELTLEVATRHNFEAANHLDFAHQLPFDLEFPGIDVSIDLRIRAHYQKIVRLDLTAEAAIDLYRQIVTEFSRY
jgi:hypothetical protein